MAKKYIRSSKGNNYIIDFFCTIEDGATFAGIADGCRETIKKLKVYYRPERTWADHMGNTPCGYFVNCPLPDGTRQRVYMYGR